MIVAALAAAAQAAQPLLLYTRAREVHVVRADGSGDRIVGRGFAPVWSPDGGRIAFVHVQGRDAAGYIVALDGRPRRRVTPTHRFGEAEDADSARVRWVADGQRVAFAARGAEVWPHTARSPDGTRFLRVRTDGRGNAQLVVTDGHGHSARLTNDIPRDPLARFRICCPTWSPDGSRIVFLRTTPSFAPGDLWVLRSDGSGERRLTWGGASTFSFSPDGRLVEFMTGNRLAVVAAGGGRVRVLAHQVANGSASWQPAHVRARPQPPLSRIHVASHRVFVRRTLLPAGRVRRTDVRQIGPAHGELLDLSRDGRFVSLLDYGRSWQELDVRDLHTAATWAVARWRYRPAPYGGLGLFSPDGTRIVFWDGRTLETIDILTRRVTVFRDAAVGSGVAWLDDGRLSYVDRRRRLVPLGLRVPLARYAELSPDGRSLEFARGCHIWMRNLVTGRLVRLHGREWGPEAWSPDSRHFTAVQGDWADHCRVFEAYGLTSHELYDRRGRRLGNVGMGWDATWSPDGRFLFLAEGETGTAVTYLQPAYAVSMRTLHVAPLFHDRVCGAVFGMRDGWILYCRYDRGSRNVMQNALGNLPQRLYVARVTTAPTPAR